jgi:phosphoribosyl-ATP pyrophosphohydrolase
MRQRQDKNRLKTESQITVPDDFYFLFLILQQNNLAPSDVVNKLLQAPLWLWLEHLLRISNAED